MSSIPLISIIIPVYNTKKYLPACFASVKNQTYENLEIILVDDGSTDGSTKLCDEYKKQDPRVKVIHQKNRGLSAARNAGIKKSTGAYLVFVDSDDTISPDAIEYLYHLIKKYHVKLAIAAVTEVYPAHLLHRGAGFHETVLTPAQALKRMLNEQGFNVSAYLKLYARELFAAVEYPPSMIHEDLGTTYKLIMKCDKIAYGPEPKYQYYQRENSITHSEFTPHKFDIITLTDQMCDYIDAKYPELKNTTNLRRMHARFSVLRLMIGAKLTKKQKTARAEIVAYLRRHKNRVLNNPEATRRDKLAMSTLNIGLTIFNFSWRIYTILEKSSKA